MKYLLVLALVAVVFWLWRSRRRDASPRQGGVSPPSVDMVQCAHCGVHLARGEALLGNGRPFCDAAHRAAFERSHG